MSDLVYWSVNEVNKQNAGRTKPLNYPCPQCGEDEWSAYYGVNPLYASQYNPGEYVEYTCSKCGYSYESQC